MSIIDMLLGKVEKKEVSQTNLWTSLEIYSTMYSRENINRILKIIKENNLIKNIEIRKRVRSIFETALKNYNSEDLFSTFLKNNIPRLIEEIDSKDYDMGYSHTEIEEFKNLSLILKNTYNQL